MTNKTLIIGAGGQIGKILVDLLRKNENTKGNIYELFSGKESIDSVF